MAEFRRYCNGRNAVIAAFAVTILGGLYVFQSPSSPTPTMSTGSTDVPGLEFTLAQTSKDPPSLSVTFKNNDPKTTYTLLTWDTPIDSAALNTGVFSITDAETGKDVEQMIMQLRRSMPPQDDQFVSLAPGEKETVEVVFDRPWMPERKPAKYKVKAEGEFKGLWDKKKSDVTAGEIDGYTSSPFSWRKFATNEVELSVE
jgi:hypothetical protein